MPFFNKHILCFSFAGSSHQTSLLFWFHFLLKYFPSCLCVVKILRTRKIYPARFITRLALCHLVRVMSSTRVRICPVRLVTRFELKCNSFCIQTEVATSNYSKKNFDYSKRFIITRKLLSHFLPCDRFTFSKTYSEIESTKSVHSSKEKIPLSRDS